MRPQLLILQGVYPEYFSFPLAQKLVSLKDVRSVGFLNGASPNTGLLSLQTYKSVIFLLMSFPDPLLNALLQY